MQTKKTKQTLNIENSCIQAKDTSEQCTTLSLSLFLDAKEVRSTFVVGKSEWMADAFREPPPRQVDLLSNAYKISTLLAGRLHPDLSSTCHHESHASCCSSSSEMFVVTL
eukprot:1160839-Amphidinium_carterae.1